MDQGGDKNYWQQDDAQLDAGAPAATEVPEHQEQVAADEDFLSWQASEDVHHEKHAIWFAGLLIVAVALLAVSILLIKSWTFAVLIVVMAVTVVFFARRPPRVMEYRLTHHGIQINERMFNFREFRGFGVLQDGSLYSVVLLPTKRFMPSVSVYFPSEQGERIVDVFGEVLPMEHVEPDLIDTITRKLHL